MLHIILANERITYDASYVLVFVASSPRPRPWPETCVLGLGLKT